MATPNHNSNNQEAPERELEEQILQMKKQHQLQHQILLQHFQQQQQHLAEQHEQQLRQHLKEFWERQKQLQELRQREQIESLRKKEKHEESAIASTEVKHKLQAFLRQRASGYCKISRSINNNTNNNNACWSEGMDTSSEITSNNNNNISNDFPLRKTASEPNLLKVRLKQRVMERRCSPMSKRHLPPTLKKKILNSCLPPNNSESPPSTQEPPKELSPPCDQIDEYSQRHPNALFSSPSMPNISVATHHHHYHHPHTVLPSHYPSQQILTSDLSEAAVRAACTARLGLPLTGQMLPGTLPFYPSLPAIESEHEDTTLDTISELQEPPQQTRNIIRPLGRTQSSPLPLGHPLLDGKHKSVAMIVPLPPTPEEQQRDLEQRSNEGGNRSIRPLSRTLSSPIVHLGVPNDVPMMLLTKRRLSSTPTTGLAYDNQMLKHGCVCGSNSTLHPEHGGRLQSIWSRLLETGLVSRCDRFRPRKATTQELELCHTESHILLYGTSSLNRHKIDMNKLSTLPLASFVRLPCGGIGVDNDTTWNEMYTGPAARMAAGCTIDLALRTWTGDIRNGFAVVRPPGHHASTSQAMGFCFFNSVAIAVRVLQRDHRVNKIMIVDWGVHHCNGTQDIFYDDPRVLVVSLHRHDDGNFFPGTGSILECGSGAGVGFNVNIAWSGGLEPPPSDAEYLAAFRTIVMPIGLHFNPDIVLVSAGFDATEGHPPPLGGYRVSSACFGHMTHQLMQLADSRIVLALEGGYDLTSICDSVEECVRVLLGDTPSPIANEELHRPPCTNAIATIQKVITVHGAHWPCLQEGAKTISMSYMEAIRSEDDDKDTVNAMASLSMQQNAVVFNLHRYPHYNFNSATVANAGRSPLMCDQNMN